MTKSEYNNINNVHNHNDIIRYIKYKNINDSSLFKEIIKYNEIDCKVLFEILNYFKKNH